MEVCKLVSILVCAISDKFYISLGILPTTILRVIFLQTSALAVHWTNCKFVSMHLSQYSTEQLYVSHTIIYVLFSAMCMAINWMALSLLVSRSWRVWHACEYICSSLLTIVALHNALLFHFTRPWHVIEFLKKNYRNLSSNNFKGQIPSELGHIVNLDTL